MFMASFLGKPPINYLEGRLERERDVLHFRRGAVSLPLSASLAARLQGASPDGGVVIGIRPEDVNDRAAPAADRLLSGPVPSVLPVASDHFSGLFVHAAPLFFLAGLSPRHPPA